MSVRADIQQLALPAIVTFYTLDLTPIAPTLPDNQRVLRFAAEPNENGQSIFWKGITWQAVPIMASGFSLSGRGTLPRPTLRITNIGGYVSALCLAYADLVQSRVWRHRTFAKYLPASNFTSGVNATADNSQSLPDELFYINRKITEQADYVEFELRWSFDLEGMKVPRRVLNENTCGSEYRSSECGWVPGAGPYYDVNDAPCAFASDECSHSLTGCEKRWQTRHGPKKILPFDAFPGLKVDLQ